MFDILNTEHTCRKQNINHTLKYSFSNDHKTHRTHFSSKNICLLTCNVSSFTARLVLRLMIIFFFFILLEEKKKTVYREISKYNIEIVFFLMTFSLRRESQGT